MQPNPLQAKREAALRAFNEKNNASQRAHAERNNLANIDPQYANLTEHQPDPAYVPPPWYAPKKENRWNPETPKTKRLSVLGASLSFVQLLHVTETLHS